MTREEAEALVGGWLTETWKAHTLKPYESQTASRYCGAFLVSQAAIDNLVVWLTTEFETEKVMPS